MPSLTSSRRLLSVASHIWLLWLLSVACADASFADRPTAVGTARAGDGASLAASPGRTSGRVRSRRSKPRRPPKLTTHDFVPRIGRLIAQRPVSAVVVQDDDPPAAHDVATDRLAPCFCRLGVVSGSRTRPRTRPFSPQPPRGPPPAA
jgi:hypothetical protein